MRHVCLMIIVFCFGFVGYCQENYYVVKKGDNPIKIAKKFNIKLEDFMSWNNLDNSSFIDVGDTLWINDPQTIKTESQDSTMHKQGSEEQIGENKDITLDKGVEQQKESINEAGKNSDVTADSGNSEQKINRLGNRKKTNTKEDKKNKELEDERAKNVIASWIWLLLGMLMGIVLGFLLVYLLYVKKLKVKLEHKDNELSRVNYSFTSEKTNSGSELSRLRSKIQSLDREKQRLFEENVSLGEEIDRLKAAQSHENENRIEQTVSAFTNQTSTKTQGSQSVLYADAIIDGYFVRISEVPNEDSVFVLHLNGENSANFGIYSPAHPRIIANPSFLEGCEKQILGNTMQLDVIEGRAQRDASNGKWKVIEKLNVIIK